MLVLRNGLLVPMLVGIKIAELNVRVGEGVIERDGFFQQRLNGTEVRGGARRSLGLPEADRVVVLSARVVRLLLSVAAEAFGDRSGLGRRAVQNFGEEKVAARVGGIEVRGAKKSVYGFVVASAGIERESEADEEARGVGIALGCILENGDRRFVGSVQKHLASPVEEVVLGWVQMGGRLVFVRRIDKLSILLVDLCEQVVQLAGVFLFRQLTDNLPPFIQSPEQKVGHGQIVAVVVRIGFCPVCPCKQRLRFGHLTRFRI